MKRGVVEEIYADLWVSKESLDSSFCNPNNER